MTAFSRLAAEPAPVKPLSDTEEWQDLKRRILRVLDRYPGAREALAQELNDDRA